MLYNEYIARDVRRLGRVFEHDPFNTELNEQLSETASKLEVDAVSNYLTFNCYSKENEPITNEQKLNPCQQLPVEPKICLHDKLGNSDGRQLSQSTNEKVLNYYVDQLIQQNDYDYRRASVSSFVSQTDNLIEEMYAKKSIRPANNRDYKNVWSTSSQVSYGRLYNKRRFLSRSTQHLRDLIDNSDDTNNDGYQSLPYRRNFFKDDSSSSFDSLPRWISSRKLHVLIAIDIGTCYSGFAYAYSEHSIDDPNAVQRMKEHKWKKVPSVLLLNSRTEFHSFGYDAIENFISIERNISPSMSQWLLFDKFKFQLYAITDINRDCIIEATNGTPVPAITIFSRALSYFKCRALQEISMLLGKSIKRDDAKWVLTIPIFWSHAGKMLMTEAAYNAGLCTPDNHSTLRIIYEADAALTWCNINDPIDDVMKCVTSNLASYVIVMNCGGGTVDISIHEYNADGGELTLINIHKTSESIYSSIGIDNEFIQLLNNIFGAEFISKFKTERPASFIQLLLKFESCKWISMSGNSCTASIALQDGFLEMYRQYSGKKVKEVIMHLNEEEIFWNDTEQTINISYYIIDQLFQPMLQKIIRQMNIILRNRLDESRVLCLYVVGGLSKSPIVQKTIEENFGSRINVIFPKSDSEVYTLRGCIRKVTNAVEKQIQKASSSYALGILKPFQDNVHPLDKLVIKEGKEWCCDLLDVVVRKGQLLYPGDIILKRYTPANYCQSHIIINIYSMENDNSKFVTDNGVHNCGVLHLATLPTSGHQPREILFQLIFSGRDFIASILDTTSGRSVQTKLDPVSYL